MIGAAVLLYACNKLWFLPAASGPLRLFLAWYFSDLLAGALLLALVELLLALGRVSPIRSVPAAAGYLLACGLFLELAPLLYKPLLRVRPVGSAGLSGRRLAGAPPGAAAAQP